jgi:hypothetical protein
MPDLKRIRSASPLTRLWGAPPGGVIEILCGLSALGIIIRFSRDSNLADLGVAVQKFTVLSAAVLSAVFLAAPAHADSSDDAFLKAIQGHGITATSDQAMITIGHVVCNEFGKGKSPNAIVAELELYGNQMSESDAKFVVQTASAAYCPEYIN